MPKSPPRWLQPTVDYGPLAAFFVAYLLGGFMWATGVIVAAAAAALALSLLVTRRVPMMSLVTAVIIAFFGGLTLWLDDKRFFMMKPTIVQALFSLVLFGGLAFKRPLLRFVLGHAWSMDREGWRRLTFRFALFFAAMAGLNELVWRTQSEAFWINFKVFGILGLTMIFAMTQAPLMQRHHLPEDDEATAQDPPAGEGPAG